MKNTPFSAARLLRKYGSVLLFTSWVLALFYLPATAQQPALPAQSHWMLHNVLGQDIGIVLDIRDGQFRAYTPPSVRRITGTAIYLAGRAGRQIRQARALVLSGAVQQAGDTLLLSGMYNSFWSEQEFSGRIVGDQFEADYGLPGKPHRNPLTGYRIPAARPATDYAPLIDKALKETEAHIYDARLVENPAWQRFSRKIRRLQPVIHNDMDLQIAWGFLARKLPFSHYMILAQAPAGPPATPAQQRKLVQFELIRPETGYLKVASFSGPKAEMDSAILLVRAAGCQNLIIDLRDNGGGSITAAMPLVQFLVQEELLGGVFVTRKWTAVHDNPPSPEVYGRFPTFSEANASLLIRGIHESEGICLRIVPDEAPYTGRVFLLVNGKTASTCEPLAYGLQRAGRATLVGEKTAGAMMSAEAMPVEGKYHMWLPTADYYTADGKRLDKVGVSPDAQVPAASALDHVLNLLAQP